MMTNDKAFERLMEFANNYQQKNGSHGLSNLYLIQSVDADGNIIDEKYGMNMMTNYGFKQFFSTSTNFPTNLYIGNGTGTIVANKYELLSAIMEDAASRDSSVGIDYNYPPYYHTESGIFTLVCRYMKAYLPATMSQFSSPFQISEYGIGTSYTALWTHSWVYDSSGRQTTVTKEPGIQLNIMVYFCLSINKSIIETMWDGDSTLDPYVVTRIEPARWSTDYTSYYTKLGNVYSPVVGDTPPTWNSNTYYAKIPHLNSTRKYILLTRMPIFFNRMHYNTLYSFKNNVSRFERNKSQTTSLFDDDTHSYTKWTNLSEFTLNQGTSDNTGYIDGFQCVSPGALFMERVLLSTPENFRSVIPYMTSNLENENCLSTAFGTTQGLEFTQMVINKAYCFNYKTGQYDLEEEIDLDDSIWYNEFLNDTNIAYSIYYNVNGVSTLMYLHVNPCNDDPILGFDGNLQTIVATDAYWDFSTWCTLTNIHEVQASERCRKYYLSSENVALLPRREKRRFNIRPINGYQRNFSFLSFKRYSRSYAVSTTRDFFVLDTYLYRISQMEVFNLGTGDNYYNTEKYIICYDDSIVTVKGNGTIYTTQYISQGTMTNTTFAHTSGITNFMNCQISEGSTYQPERLGQNNAGKNGLVMFSLPNSTALLLKIRSGLNITENVISDSLAACMINGTTNYAYILTTNDHEVVVANGENGSTVTTVTLDSSLATPTFMFGFRDKLYVCDGSTYTILIDLGNSGTITTCTNKDGTPYAIPYTSGISNIRTTSVDDVIVIYNINSYNRSKEFYIRYDQPSTIVSLNGLGVPSTISTNNSNVLRLYEKYGGLYLVWNTNYYTSSSYDNNAASTIVYDFAKFIYDGTTAYASRENTVSPYILFGDHLIFQNKSILLSNFLQHEITGTTNTVTAHNNIKNLSGEVWTTVITNLPSDYWQGIPPGKMIGDS